MSKTAICNSCNEEIAEVTIRNLRVTGDFGQSVSCYCCPHCNVILSCQPDLKLLEQAAETAIEAAFRRRAKF